MDSREGNTPIPLLRAELAAALADDNIWDAEIVRRRVIEVLGSALPRVPVRASDLDAPALSLPCGYARFILRAAGVRFFVMALRFAAFTFFSCARTCSRRRSFFSMADFCFR